MKHNASILLSYLLPRLQDLVFITVFLFGMMLGPRFIGDGDTGRHIVVGKIIVTEQYIPVIDVFSHTKSGLLLTTTEWLSEAVFAIAYLAMGLNGVVLLSAILIGVTFALVFHDTFQNNRSFIFSFGLILLIAFATLFHWLARPHLFSWLMLAIWLPRMDQLARGDTRNVWQFPLLMLLWANLHGGFILGILVCAAYLAGWLVEYLRKEAVSVNAFKNLLIAGVLSLLVTLINPSGMGLWKNVFGHVGDRELMTIHIEWLSPDFHNPNTWPFLIFIVLLVLSFSSSGQSVKSGRSFLATGMILLGLYSVRNIPFSMIACLPILGTVSREFLRFDTLQQIEQKLYAMQAGLRGGAWSLLTVIAIASLLISGQSVDVFHQGNVFDSSLFPVRAVDWLAVHPQSGNVFNEFTWGGYILFRLWPEQKVFIDGQTDFYGADLAADYLTVLNARKGWKDILEEYEIDWVLLPRDVPLVEMLKTDSRWRTLYEDNISIILKK